MIPAGELAGHDDFVALAGTDVVPGLTGLGTVPGRDMVPVQFDFAETDKVAALNLRFLVRVEAGIAHEGTIHAVLVGDKHLAVVGQQEFGMKPAHIRIVIDNVAVVGTADT